MSKRNSDKPGGWGAADLRHAVNALARRRRGLNAAGAAACAALIGYALYEQHVAGLEPCHLCILQRVAVVLLGALFLAAAVHGPSGLAARAYAILLGVVASSGMAIAARHVWLQHQPPGSVAACGADLEFMLKVLPLKEVLVKVFKGGAECQRVDWSLLGLSMPVWVFLTLAGLGAAGLAINWAVPAKVDSAAARGEV